MFRTLLLNVFFRINIYLISLNYLLDKNLRDKNLKRNKALNRKPLIILYCILYIKSPTLYRICNPFSFTFEITVLCSLLSSENYIENIIHCNVCSESRFSDPQPKFVRDQDSTTDCRICQEAVRLLYARGEVRAGVPNLLMAVPHFCKNNHAIPHRFLNAFLKQRIIML